MRRQAFFLLLALGAHAPAPAAGDDDLLGYWRGALIREGSLLFADLRIDQRGEDDLAGALTLEEWGLYDSPAAIAVDGSNVTVSILGAPARLHCDRESGEMIGTVNLGDAEVTVHWKRHPFAPEPRFRQQEVQFENGDVTLAGTLVTPHGPGPFPAVVLVAGRSYGPRTGMMPFAALFAQHGVAALAFDGRGRGGSQGDPLTMTDRNRIDDAHAAYEFLVEREEIAAESIGMLGESTGGWIIPICAQENPEVAFLVLIVGPAESLVEQQAHVPRYRMLFSSEDFTEAELDAAEDYQRRLTQHLIDHGSYAEWAPEVKRASGERWSPWVDLPTSFDNPAYAFYRNQPYDNVEALRETTAPVLALYGGADFVVPAEVNVPRLRALLEEAGNEDFAIHTFDGADHSLFLPAGYRGEGDFPRRYYRWMRPAPGYYSTLASWIVEHTR